MNKRLADLLREEELKWYQRAKAKNLLEGDANTKYFHLVANGKHRKSHIFRLEQEEGLIHGEKELREYIPKYYKELFGPSKSIPMTNLVVMISLKYLYRKMKC
jgi:mannosylglycoprotein endo-beta-mannosidase